MIQKNVLDKDGISAMVIGSEMYAYLKSIGRTLYEQLNQRSLLYGYHINNNSYVICNQTNVMLKMFDRLRHYDRLDYEHQQILSSTSIKKRQISSFALFCLYVGKDESTSK